MAVNMSIKNVPEELAQVLREQAKRNHRSLQGELLAILEEKLVTRKITADSIYARVQEMGLKTGSETVEMVQEDRVAR